jgi:hypothetical protein
MTADRGMAGRSPVTNRMHIYGGNILRQHRKIAVLRDDGSQRLDCLTDKLARPLWRELTGLALIILYLEEMSGDRATAEAYAILEFA